MQVFRDFKIALMQVFWGFKKFGDFLFKLSGSTDSNAVHKTDRFSDAI